MSEVEVTTIGNVIDKPLCGCKGFGSSRRMGNLDDFAILFPPLWPFLIGRKAAGAVAPSGSFLDDLANRLGLNPIAFVIGTTGYSGMGEYWPAVRNVGLAAAFGAAAVAAAHAVRKRKGKKHVRR